MRILLMGAGQVGGIVGGRLVRGGHDVTFCDLDREHVDAIRTRGLRVDLPGDSFSVMPTILFPQELTGTFDLVFIAVRSEATEGVLNLLSERLSAGALLVSLQNGMNLPLLVERVGAERAVGAVVRMRSMKIGPGHVRTSQSGYLYIGQIHGRRTVQLNALQSMLDAVIQTRLADNIFGLLWSKLTFTSMRMLAWIADAKMPAIWQTEANRRLFAEFITEIIKVGVTAGACFENLAEYDPKDFHPNRSLEQRMTTVAAMARTWKDEKETGGGLKRGEKTEVEGIIGRVISEGRRLGVETLVCLAVLKVYREVEARQRPIGMQNYAELYTAC